MTWQTLFIADSDALMLAREWAAAGLVGGSLWLESSRVLEAAIMDASAQQLPGETTQRLGDFLGNRLNLEELRLVWLGSDSSSSGLNVETMHALRGDLVSRLGPRHTSAVAIFPRTHGLKALPAMDPNWARLVLGSDESITPGAPVGELRDSALAVLHAGLILGGVTGGDSEILPRITPSDTTAAITPFSSVALGHRELQESTTHFIRTTLADSDAAALRPSNFDNSLSDRLSADAFKYLRSAHGYQLSYRPPDETFRFRNNPVMSTRRWYHHFSAFIDFLFLRSKPVSWTNRLHNEVAQLLQGEDMGWAMEQRPDEPGIIPADDVHAIDQQVCEDQRELWNARKRSQGELPPPEVWQDLTGVICGLIDGGELPSQVNRPAPFDRPTSVPVSGVLTPTASRDGDADARAQQISPMINGQHFAPTTDAIRSSAIAQVQSYLESDPGTLLPLPSNAGSKVAATLAQQADSADAEIRERQLEALDDPGKVGELPLLDRLRASILGDAIRARMDADRWFEIATGPFSGLINLGRAVFWFLLGTGAVVSGFLISSLALRAGWIMHVLTAMGIAGSGPASWGLVGGTSLILVVGPIVWFYFRYNAFHHRSKRQAEARWLMFARAEIALYQNLKLHNADRILSSWNKILTGIYPASARRRSSAPETNDLELPVSLVTGTPVYSDDEMRTWLTDHAGRTGWRSTTLKGILAGADNADVWSDHGQSHGVLDEFATTIDDHWESWVSATATHITDEIETALQNEPQRPVTTRYGEEAMDRFFARIESDHYVPAPSYGPPGNLPPGALLSTSVRHNHGIRSFDVIHSESRLYLRTLPRPSTEQEIEPKPVAERI